MKISRAKIVNFRNIEDTLIEFDRLTVFRGRNANGKTSIQQALEFALTGRCDATDAGGKGMAALIRQGADRAGILFELASNRTYDVTCTLTPKPERTLTFANHADPADRGEAVKGWVEKTKPVLSCLLNAHYFINLDPKEQKNLLASIILRDTYGWPEEIKAKCSAVHITLPWERAPFDVIEAGYKAAFEARTAINRDIKSYQVPEPIAIPEGTGSLTDERARLEALHNQADALALARSKATKERSTAEGDIRVLETRIASYEAKIRQEQQALAAIETLTAKQVKDLEKTAKGAEKLAALEGELGQVRRDIAGVDALLRQFEALDGKNDCPTCHRAVDDDFLVSAMQPHVEKKNALAIRERDLLKEQVALGDVAGAQRKLEQAKTDETHAKRSKALTSETEAFLRTSRGELETLQSRLPAAAPEASEEESKIRTDIRTLESTIAQVAVADQRAQDIIRAKERLTKMQQAQATLESLVAYFGKDGVKAQLLAEDIGPFASAMNEALAGWGYAVSFEIEPYGFRVTNLDKHRTLDIQLLSGSEKLRFSVAFQVALAQVSGIRMVVVDEADILDSAGRSAFYELLLSADLDQAIAIGTDEREEVPEVPGAVFYAIEDGSARLLQPQRVEA